MHCDVADEAQVAAAIAAIAATVESFGNFDIGYNNAGIQAPVIDAADEPAGRFDRLSAIDLRVALPVDGGYTAR